MSERITRFLAENRPETPCLVVDLDVIAEAYDLLRWYLPLARVYYAVKANPAPQIVAMLERKGANFDVASRGAFELDKLARAAPGGLVFCRILVACDGAEWRLSRKFACAPEIAVELLCPAR